MSLLSLLIFGAVAVFSQAEVASPPPITAGPGTPITNELTDQRLAELLLSRAQLMGVINDNLRNLPVVADVFARLGGREGCIAWNQAVADAVAHNANSWNAAMVAAARATIPSETLEAYGRASIRNGDALIAPYEGRLSEAFMQAGGHLVAQRAIDDTVSRLTRTMLAAPPNGERERNLSQLAAERAKGGSFCAVPPPN